MKTVVWQEPQRRYWRRRTQSLARVNLGHEPEVLREVFRAETVIHQDTELENHSFWYGQPVKLLQQRCHMVVSTEAVDQSRCRVENIMQLAKMTGRMSSQDSVAVVQPC